MKKSFSIATLVAFAAIEVFAQDNITKLEEVSVTTSSMNEVLLKNTPSTVSVITAKEIKDAGAINVLQILKRVPGLSISTGAGNGTISIRGGDFQDVLFLLNGRKLAGAEGRKGKFQKNEWITENIDINSIEKIEVLRGSASVLYGSEASAGVINIITKKSKEQSVNAGFQAGNYKLSNYYNIDLGQKGNWGATANFNLIKKQAVRRNFERVNGAYYDSPEGETYNAMFDVDYFIDQNNKLNFFTLYSKVDEFYLKNEVDRETTDPLEKAKTRQDENRYNAAVTYSGNTKNNSYISTLSYDRFLINDYDRDTASVLEESYYAEIISFDARNTWNMNEYSLLTFGGTYSTSKTTNKEVREVWDEQNLNSIDEYAFFVQDEFFLFDEKLYIVPALRYDDFSTFGTNWTPSIGATYHISSNHRIKANFGEAFEAPSTTQLFGGGRHEGDLNLKPKETENYELRYEGEYKKLSGSVTVYKSDYKNLIFVEDLFENGNKFTRYANIGKAENEGFELELGYDFTDNFGGSASFVRSNFMDLDKNERLEDSPKGVLNAEVYYNNPIWNFSGTLYGQHVIDKYTTFVGETGNYIIPQEVSYNTFGFSLRKTWNKKYTLILSADNIFDNPNDKSEEYLDPTSYSASFEAKF